MTYDSVGGQLASFTDPLGRTTQFTFEADGSLAEDVGPGGDRAARIAMSEASAGDGAITTTSAEGQVRSYLNRRPAAGAWTREVTNSAGLTTSLVRRADGSRTATRPDGVVIDSAESPDPRFGDDAPYVSRELVRFPDGRLACASSVRSVDGSGTWIEETSEWETSAANCEAPGEPRRVSTVRHDPVYRAVTYTTPGGRSEVTVLDGAGRATEHRVPGLAPVQLTYDARGRVERIQRSDGQGNSRELRIGYDPATGYVQTLHDAGGTTVHYAADPLGRVHTATLGWDEQNNAPNPDAVVTRFGWDAVGNLTALTPPGRPAHRMSYGPRDQLELHVAPAIEGAAMVSTWRDDRDGRTTGGEVGEFFDADRDGTFEAALRASAEEREYYPASAAVGSRHRLRQVRFASHPESGARATLERRYAAPGASEGPPGAVIGLMRSDGADLAFRWNGPELASTTVSIPTAPGNQLRASVHQEYANPGYASSGVRVSAGGRELASRFRTDADGVVREVSIADGADTLARMTLTPNAQHGLLESTEIGVVRSRIERNAFGEPRLIGYEWRESGIEHALRFEYSYDRAGRIWQVVETRVRGASSETKTLEYSYDSASRLTRVRWNGVVSEDYVYDANGNRLEWTTDADGPGPLPAVVNRAAIYDVRDRLISYVRPGGEMVLFTYDAAGRLRSKTEGAANTSYVYDARGNLLRVELPDGRVVEYIVDGLDRRAGRKVDGEVTDLWLYKDGLEPIAELDGAGRVRRVFGYGERSYAADVIVERDPESGEVTVRRALRDHVGSLRVLVDAHGASAASEMELNAFGALGRGSRPEFAGAQVDTETGLVRFGARDYNSELGRWTAADPALWQGHQSNLYSYAHQNPVAFVDRTGRNPGTAVALGTVGGGSSWGALNITGAFLVNIVLPLVVVAAVVVGAWYLYDRLATDDPDTVVAHSGKPDTEEEKAFNKLRKDLTRPGTPLSDEDADALIDLGCEIGYPVRVGPNDTAPPPNHWVGGPHIHIGGEHVRVRPGFRPRRGWVP